LPAHIPLESTKSLTSLPGRREAARPGNPSFAK